MKRTMLGAIIAIMSVGIGPAMLAGPSAVLADEADDEESEEEAHDPENSGGGGGGGCCVEDRLDPLLFAHLIGAEVNPTAIAAHVNDILRGIGDLPAWDSLRDELDGRIRMDLPELKLVGPDKTKIRVPPPIEPHKPDKGCCGTELTPEQDALLHTVPEVPDPPNLPKDEIVVPKIDTSIKDEIVVPKIDIVEDLKQESIKVELDVR